MKGSRSASDVRAYRIVRGGFAVFFLVLLAWVLSRYELTGWPLLIAVLSGLSIAINVSQAITGPSSRDSK